MIKVIKLAMSRKIIPFFSFIMQCEKLKSKLFDSTNVPFQMQSVFVVSFYLTFVCTNLITVFLKIDLVNGNTLNFKAIYVRK